MTAANHALTGALIGLTIGNPWVAAPLALLSHFICDIIPHYDVPGKSAVYRMRSKLFFRFQILGGALLCFGVVLALAILRPDHWLLAAICAFIATSPDLLYIPRFLHAKRTGKDNMNSWWFWKFHNNIQWFQKPIGAVVEIVWAAGALTMISTFVR